MVSVNVLDDSVSLRSVPAPEMMPDSVCADAESYEKIALVPMEMFGEYVPLPKVPVTDTVPPESLSVVVPEYVLVPASTNVPAAVFVRLKAPETAPDIVPVLVSATFTVELPVIAAAPLNVPVDEKYTADEFGE